jgi:ribosomal protein S18 acetylase RimI-like enzyme
MAPLTLRQINGADAPTVAALHAASWRTAYRGILTDDFLSGEVDLERKYVWEKRLSTHDDAQFGLLACFGELAVGFVYIMARVDPVFGTLIDNLHVSPESRSAGIGPRLLSGAADEMAARGWERGVHLWVWDANTRARAFYARMGGREVETGLKSAPDGTEAQTWRVVWEDYSALRLASR